MTAPPISVDKLIDPVTGTRETVRDPDPPFQMLNSSVIAQLLVADTANYIEGSQIRIPRTRLMGPGTVFRWRWSMTKTAAGTASSIVRLRVGTAGSVADSGRLAITKAAGTAAVDEALCELFVLVRTGGAAGTWAGSFRLTHNLASTGHATVPCLITTTSPAAFDMTPEGLIVGLSMTPGASDVITVQHVTAECLGLIPSG